MSFNAPRQEQTSKNWENACEQALMQLWDGQSDSAHDVAHVRRVRHNACVIAADMPQADLDVILAAVWLHDGVNLPKDHPQRAQASTLSAQKAADILAGIPSFPQDKIEAVKHAIAAHSFSAGIKPETLEAEIVQDADRLDALGAIGMARCFAVSGALGRALVHADDPLCEERTPNDKEYAVDHFFVKLFKLPDGLNTEKAKGLARARISYMRGFLKIMKEEQGL